MKQQTIYEYHRVEINTTRIVGGSAFEFTPLPSECPHTWGFGTALPHYPATAPLILDPSSLSPTHILRALHDIQPDHGVRLVQHTSAVGWVLSKIIAAEGN